MAMVDAIQKADGVEIVEPKQIESRYGTLPYAPVDGRLIPDAGYMRVYNYADLTINYKTYVSGGL
ncbi:hypothetical protein D3C79_1120110 [compost metagenome]